MRHRTIGRGAWRRPAASIPAVDLRDRVRRGPVGNVGAVLLGAWLLLAACGGGTPTSSPSASPSATPASLLLPDPTTAGAVYTNLRQQGILVVGTNAIAGKDPVNRINATYEGQPLAILGYSSDLARAKFYAFRDATKPERGDPTYTFAGLNIVVEFGPSTPGKRPAAPDPGLATSAQQLAAQLERLLGALDERSEQRVSVPRATPVPVTQPTPTEPLAATASPS